MYCHRESNTKMAFTDTHIKEVDTITYEVNPVKEGKHP